MAITPELYLLDS